MSIRKDVIFVGQHSTISSLSARNTSLIYTKDGFTCVGDKLEIMSSGSLIKLDSGLDIVLSDDHELNIFSSGKNQKALVGDIDLSKKVSVNINKKDLLAGVEYKEMELNLFLIGLWIASNNTRTHLLKLSDEQLSHINIEYEIIKKNSGVNTVYIKELEYFKKFYSYDSTQNLPNRFIFNTLEQRELLLSGIVFSCGKVVNDKTVLKFKNKYLKEDVKTLLITMGKYFTVDNNTITIQDQARSQIMSIEKLYDLDTYHNYDIEGIITQGIIL